jgi:hypothetical protein
MSTRCEECKNRLKCAVQRKPEWNRSELMNEIDLVFVDILIEELQRKLTDVQQERKNPGNE